MAWRDLYHYWLDRCADGVPPSRKDIDPPLQIPKLLANLMLIETVPAGFRVRLVGSEITRRVGIDGTGQIIDSARMTAYGVPVFLQFLGQVATRRSPTLYSVSGGGETGSDAIGLLLPLAGGNHLCDMILGGLFYEPHLHRTTNGRWTPGALLELQLHEELARADPVRYGR